MFFICYLFFILFIYFDLLVKNLVYRVILEEVYFRVCIGFGFNL